LRVNGRKYSDCAVLYRTNAQSRVIEEAFLQRGVPYRIFGGLKFYDRKEIKDIMAYLRLALNPADDISLLRVINVPKRGIGDGTIAKLQTFASTYGISLFDALGQADRAGISGRLRKSIAEFAGLIENFAKMQQYLAVPELTEEILKRTGYLEALKAERTLEAEARVENLQEFLSVTTEFHERWSPEEDGVSELQAFLTEVALVADTDLNGGKPVMDHSDSDQVVMMTLHSAKGLEFPVVFLAGMEEGMFPHSRTLDSEHEMEEERRLCYVGITRAKEKLYLTTCSTRMVFGEYRSCRPSRFLSEMPQALIEQDTGPKPEKRAMWEPRAGSSGRSFLSIPSSFGADLSVDYNVGDAVEHRKWGLGKVRDTFGEGENLELLIEFPPPIGQRRLLAKFAPIVKK
jgi:DNA helicase II / ATP-dependent DNA helicase PcrA